MSSAQIAQAAELLGQARYAIAVTGAGLSTPSGIPDFRSPTSGLWHTADPFEVASFTAFRHYPHRFFHWVRPLVVAIQAARPNLAHLALAALETANLLKLVITQNIDSLQQRAGSQQVLELHGHLRAVTCLHCHRVFSGEAILTAFCESGQIPYCPDCGGVLKPNVILMGEQLLAADLREARAAAHRADVVLVAGSSLEVFPCAELPAEAVRRGARLIIANLAPTYLDDQAEVVIHADVAETLPQLAEACGVLAHG